MRLPCTAAASRASPGNPQLLSDGAPCWGFPRSLLGFGNLLEGLTGLGEARLLVRGQDEATDEQPEEEIHRMSSRAGTWVPMEVGCVTLPIYRGVFVSPEAPQTLCSWDFMEASSRRPDRSLVHFQPLSAP